MAHAAEANLFRHLLPVGSQQSTIGTPGTASTTPTSTTPQPTKRPRTDEQQGRRPPRRGKHQERNARQGQGNQDRDISKLVEAAAKLTLKLADEHQLLLQDCGFTWFVSTEQGGVLPMMYGISSEWKKLKEETPQQITRSLHALMLECIVVELQARVKKVAEDSNVREAAVQAGWCTEAREWCYKTWDPIKKELVAAAREPLTTVTIENTIIEILADIKEQGVLHKFHASQAL